MGWRLAIGVLAAAGSLTIGTAVGAATPESPLGGPLARPGAATITTGLANRVDRPTPRMRNRDARAIAQFDTEAQRVLRYRPGAILVAEWQEAPRDWVVHIREAGSTRDLARVTIDDRLRRITDRWFLDFDRYPPRLTSLRARAIARRDLAVRDAARAFGGLDELAISSDYVDGDHWEVDFSKGDRVKIRADVRDSSAQVSGVWTGHQIAWKMARGSYHAFGGDINLWYVWWPLFAAFALVMLEPLHLRSWRSLDVVALLSFGLSHALFDRAMIDWSVPLAVPPLLYLFLRMTLLFVRGVPAAEGAGADAPEPFSRSPLPRRHRWRRRLALWPPTWLLVALALFAAGMRYGVNTSGSNVIDVGYAGVAGANQVLDGKSPYGNMPSDNQNGDTYGPFNYLAYVPAVAIWSDADEQEWSNGLPAAHAVSIASDLLCVLALIVVGWRWMSRRAAAFLACGWLVYPYTAFALCNNVNDLLVAALLLLAFAALPRAWLRGGLVALAAAVKFAPLVVLAPIAHAGVYRRHRQVIEVLAAAALIAAACVVYLASHDHGIDRFIHATWGFQYDRSSPFSLWGLYGWRVGQQIAQALLGAALLLAFAVPRARDFRQVAAGAAAALLGVQLVLQHWFYLYIPWFAGFVLIVLVAQRTSSAAPLGSGDAPYTPRHDDAAEHPPRSLDPRSRLVEDGR